MIGEDTAVALAPKLEEPEDGEFLVHQRKPHDKQLEFINSAARRKVIRAGRRGGKTTGIGYYAVMRFLEGKRVLYTSPTSEQIDMFWSEVNAALRDLIDGGWLTRNLTRHIIEWSDVKRIGRIRAKTAWNADTLRGDWADCLIFDEWQLMNESAWEDVGAPMLLDNNGEAVFIYTPPRMGTKSVSKATDKRHAAKLFKRAKADDSGRWEAFHFSSHDNPHISKEALAEIVQDMTPLAYRMEILAEDIDFVPGALWTPDMLDDTRLQERPYCHRIIVGVDPQASTGQTGIVVVGAYMVNGVQHGCVLADYTTAKGAMTGEWAGAVIQAYNDFQADLVVGETNNGGDMVEAVIRAGKGGKYVNYEKVYASRGKYTRAEPIAALYKPPPQMNMEPKGHMAGDFPLLEEELCSWVPGDESPNRLDAMVWAYTALDLHGVSLQDIEDLGDIGEDFTSPYA